MATNADWQPLPLPTYLNATYIRGIVDRIFDSRVWIRECHVKLNNRTGENFCSDIYRVIIRYQHREDDVCAAAVVQQQEKEVLQMSLIFKDMNDDMAQIGSNEGYMYRQVLPEMERKLGWVFGMAAYKLKPICYFVDNSNKELYVLEDLEPLGYRLADRFLGLDELHSLLLMKKIAQFHAASMVYMAQHPDEIGHLQAAHFSIDTVDPIGRAIAQGGMEYALHVVEQWEDYEGLVAKIRANISKFDERMQDAIDPTRSPVNVINHGDLWVNNFMYTYNEEQPRDLAFIDFQNCFIGSPGFDLNYFLYTSVQMGVLQCSRYKLLRFYYKSLKDTLLHCGADALVPTWEAIQGEVNRCAFIGYYAALCELPICCMSAEAADGFTAQQFLDGDVMSEKYMLLYGNERVLEMLRYVLDYFDELGVLD